MKLFYIMSIVVINSITLSCQVHNDSTYTSYFRKCGLNSGWNAGDATISIPLADGRAIWLFGDSYTNRPICATHQMSCLYDVRNCMMVQSSTNPSEFTTFQSPGTGYARTTFKYGTDNQTNYFLWPGHGFTEGDTTYIFFHRWFSSNGFAIDSFAGNFIAKIRSTNQEILSINSLSVPLGFHFGRAVIRDDDSGYFYIYNNRVQSGFYYLHLSRTPISNPLQSWQYYDGNSWVSDFTQSQAISPVAISSSLSVFRRNGLVYIVTQEPFGNICGLGREIYAMESPSLTGPFELKRLLYTIEDKIGNKYLATYNAQAHPWSGGDLLISYNVNDNAGDTLNCPAQCHPSIGTSRSADSYRPKFIRVPYSDLRIQGLLNETDVFLVAGESNAVGQGDELQSKSSFFGNAYQIDMSKRLLYPLKDPVGYNDISTGFQKSNTGSFLPSLAKSLSERCGKIPLIVHTARANTFCHQANSTLQNNWSETGVLFNHCTNRLNQILGLTGNALQAVIWSQGESDAQAIRTNIITPAQYQGALENLIQRFRTEFGIQLPFFIVKTGQNTLFYPDIGINAVRSTQTAVAASDAYAYIVYDSTYYFPDQGWMSNHILYNQQGLNQIGISSGDSICIALYPNDYILPVNQTLKSDEFDNLCTFPNWTHLSDTEGWDALHLQELSLNQNGDGKLIFVPHTTAWNADYKGPFLYKEISGNFSIDLKLNVSNRNLTGIPASDYSLAGIMLRTAKTMTNGVNDWVAGQENYIFISTGFASESHPSCPACQGPHLEIKNTINSNSTLYILPVNSQSVLLKAVRVRSYIIVLFSTNNGLQWNVAGRFHRPDMPDTLQAGIVAYTDWNKVSTYTPQFHNNNNLINGMIPDPSSNPSLPFNPDVKASFDYFRVQNEYLPGTLRNLDLTDTSLVRNNQLICLYGNKIQAEPKLRETLVWNGLTDNNWMNPINWNGNMVPDAQSRVIINDCSCLGVHSPMLNSTAQIRSLIVSEQCEFEVGVNGNLTLTDQLDDYNYVFLNEGNVIVSGVVQILLTSNQSINKGSIEILLDGEIIISK